MDAFAELELQDCPLCGGAGLLEEEGGWCLYVQCLDCGCHTAELSFRSPEERLEAARRSATTWTLGKAPETEAGACLRKLHSPPRVLRGAAAQEAG